MSKSKEEQIAAALNRTAKDKSFWTEERIKRSRDYEPGKLERIIRDRVRELLDELKMGYRHNRTVNNCGGLSQNFITIIKAGFSQWKSGCIPDSELPEKEQDLLIWLAEKGVRK